ncbi:diguanylate cyclase (GGDEF)-like protein [Friedmanniella endophytica]|uniref:Diguanylate cyclase (GGDEF)-like protein n=1 Tax=Microlunatus kandeliicorticis TaxID=1759536 RepID=A0A7W3IVL5_9ACTN|nr:EAL domain-containing protein [Microlunatus kandeliicorticis]MBA8796091.1 diguanylate cyclase (GGDEF)-like protein [Microlunatus kandeliicorticis]
MTTTSSTARTEGGPTGPETPPPVEGPPTPAPPAGTRRVPLWAGYAAGGALLVVVLLLLPHGLVRDGVYLLIGLLGIAGVLVGVRLHRPRQRLPWYLMAAGQGFWVAGDLLTSVQEDVLRVTMFPSPADVVYVLGYPLILAGLNLLVRARIVRQDSGGVLDSLVVTTGLALLGWVLLVQPTVESYRTDPVAAAVALLYPVADIAVLGTLVQLLTRSHGRNRSVRLLLAAVVLLVLADAVSTSLSLFGSDTGPLDALWLLSYLVWGAAALHPSMREACEPAPAPQERLSRTRLAVLGAAVLVAPAILAVEAALGLRLSVWPVVVGATVAFGLVVARMGAANAALARANDAREQAQAELVRQAAQDPLTGLANRAQARQLLTQALSRAQRTGALIGVLFVDLDGFKAVNDNLGHRAGDEVLQTLAQRMQTAVRTGDVVARLGGDEFVVVLEPLDEEASAVLVGERLIAVISAPITLSSGRKTWVGASVGVALSQDARIEPDHLLNEADVAVYRAKEAGRGRIEVFDDRLRAELAERSALENGLARAIENDELVLHYQPIVGLRTGEVEGYEALVRWQRPGHGLLLPGAFLPVAERSDLICELDAWVLREACRQLAVWRAADPATDLVVSVNLSRRHVARARVVEDVALALAAAGLEPRRLVLEVTEDALAEDLTAIGHLAEIRELGVRISMDDFGTGYNSLARLEHLPVDEVKIDRSFLTGTGASDRLLRLVVQAAHAFDLAVVAEGVERPEQLDTLRAIDCEAAQGYLLGRPEVAGRAQSRVAELGNRPSTVDASMATRSSTGTAGDQR